MVKKVIKEVVAEEIPEESQSVAVKKENQKKIVKQQKLMKTLVKQKIDTKQVQKAIAALKKYTKTKRELASKAKDLLNDEEDAIFVSFTLAQVPTKPSPKPLMIPLDHPFSSEGKNTRVCLFVKDPARALKDQLCKVDSPCIAKVIGYDKLKRNFKQFKDKRALLQDYDAFLADVRIYKMLPECLGNSFYNAKKFPCPLKLHGLDDEALATTLNQASASTFFSQGNGPNYSVKVGLTNQKDAEVVKNTVAALEKALAHVTVWDQIPFESLSQITMKAGDSPELPVYNFLSDEDLKAKF